MKRKTLTQTEKRIRDQANRLEALKPRLRRRDAFGGDIHAKLDAQVAVLRKRMDEDEICERWPGDYAQVEERNSALDALAWMEGEREEPGDLVSDWGPLCEAVKENL